MIFSFDFFSKPIKNILHDYAEFVFLLGSAGTERFNKDSDVDVAVFWKEKTSKEQIQKCGKTLDEEFNRDVDLVSLNKIDPIFARQVLETGRIIFSNSDGPLLKWKMEMMSIYPDFKFTRKIIEENILNRKKYV